MAPTFFIVLNGQPPRYISFPDGTAACKAYFDQFGGMPPDQITIICFKENLDVGGIETFTVIPHPPKQVIPDPYTEYGYDLQQK